MDLSFPEERSPVLHRESLEGKLEAEVLEAKAEAKLIRWEFILDVWDDPRYDPPRERDTRRRRAGF